MKHFNWIYTVLLFLFRRFSFARAKAYMFVGFCTAVAGGFIIKINWENLNFVIKTGANISPFIVVFIGLILIYVIESNIRLNKQDIKSKKSLSASSTTIGKNDKLHLNEVIFNIYSNNKKTK